MKTGVFTRLDPCSGRVVGETVKEVQDERDETGVGDLEITEDMEVQRRSWAFQLIGSAHSLESKGWGGKAQLKSAWAPRT
jgi:hypothetical protein